MIRVFVADDHTVVREGLARVLDVTPGMVFVGAAEGTREILQQVRDCDWDVLILDLSLPGGGGLEVLRQLQTLRPDIRTVVYSMHPEQQYGARVLQMGAAAYLCKSRSLDELIEAIRRAHGGLRYVTQPIAEQLLDPHNGDGGASKLSDRELQILELMVDGSRTSEIASKLCISASTVSTHIKRIKDKLHVNSTTELVGAAVRDGIVARSRLDGA